jgi:hypothetical protein
MDGLPTTRDFVHFRCPTHSVEVILSPVMASFDDAWTAVAIIHDREVVSPALRSFLQAVYREVLSEPLSQASLKKSLEELLEFLAGVGRTNANCWAVDLFFSLTRGWERDWADVRLPEGFHDALSLMGEALHDTVKDPDIARNFGCLPEQLLERVRSLAVSDS